MITLLFALLASRVPEGEKDIFSTGSSWESSLRIQVFERTSQRRTWQSFEADARIRLAGWGDEEEETIGCQHNDTTASVCPCNLKGWRILEGFSQI